MICFNPRTHGGYDHYPIQSNIDIDVLIPVPMEGTMVLLLEIAINSYVLIPVPTEGTMAKLYKINNNSTVLFR